MSKRMKKVKISVTKREKDDPLTFHNLSELEKLNEKYEHNPEIKGFFDSISEEPEKFAEACQNIGKNAKKYPQYRSNPKKLWGRFQALRVFNKQKNQKISTLSKQCGEIAIEELKKV